jgi:twitching motility protein PilT
LPDSVKKFCRLSKGLVLVTGPTGSGKSTTLAAMIDLINSSRSEHIITIEDPIEFVHPNKNCLINQREVHNHTRSFKAALRAALREDPDIVLVGEMRDLETTHIAIETAETGHLVFGTLHTTTAISTVDRLIDQFPAEQQQQIRTMLAGTLKGVVAQNLLKKKGGGRVAAIEVLVVNFAVASLIREAKTSQIMSIMQTAKKEGMTLLNEELGRFVKDGLVDPEEAWMKAVDKEGLVKTLESLGINYTPPAE